MEAYAIGRAGFKWKVIAAGPVMLDVELKRLCSLLVLGLGVGVLMGWDVIWHPAFFRVL